MGSTKLRILALWAGLLAIGISPARAQLFEEEEVGPATRISELLQYVQFRVVTGRIVSDSTRQGLSLTTETHDLSRGRWERLTVDMSNSSPSLRYQRKTGPDEILIEMSDDDHLVARRAASGSAAAVEFEQPSTGDLKLTLGSGDERRVVQAATLWQLLLMEPEAGHKQLIPLLEILNPSWQLSTKAATIESALQAWAKTQRHVSRARLTQLVQELGAPQFLARRVAERELASIGEPALMYLAALRRQDLDAEQWQRVQSLVAVMSGTNEDTVDRSVAWLAGDPGVWLALLARDDEATRRAAADELRLLLGTPIEFDPAARGAEHAAQIKRLHSLVEKVEAAEVHPPDDVD